MNSPREEVLTELKNHGWSQVRQSGSHMIFKNPLKPNTISVPQDSRGHNTRTYKGILCALRNGSKFERRELKGVTMETQQPKPAGTLSPELKAQILTNMKHIDEWKPVAGFADYEVSRDGAVQRAYRTLSNGTRTKLEHPIPCEISTIAKTGGKRPVVYLSNGSDKAYTTASVLKLVATAFLQPPPAAMSVPVAVVKNENHMDARAENLKWVSRTDLIIAGKKLQKKNEAAATEDGGHKGPSDDQILAAAEAFENGATLEKAGRLMKCSPPTAKKHLGQILGEAEFQAMLGVHPSERKRLAKEKRKLAKKNRKLSMKPDAPPAPYIPAPGVEMPKPVAYAKTPEAAAKYDLPLRPTTMSLTDITNMKAEVRNGMAYVELEMEMGSPTFLLLCKWQAKKG